MRAAKTNVVVPSKRLNEVNLISVRDERLPSGGIEPVVRSVDPILVPTADTVMGVERRGDGSHVLLGAEVGDIGGIGGEVKLSRWVDSSGRVGDE